MQLLQAKADPSRTPIHFLQESCRSGTYQTLRKNLPGILHFRQTCQIMADQTFLADSDVSCKILAGHKRFLATFLDGSCRTMSEN